jgi:anti-anti-sigma factor
MTGDLVVVPGMDVDARDAFISTVNAAINKAAGSSVGQISVNCSKVETLDGGTLGMLIVVARSAQRRGTRLALGRPSKRVRAELDAAGVSHFFDWKK